MNIAKAGRVKAINTAAPLTALLYQAGSAKDAQMLGDGLPAQPKSPDDFSDRALTIAEHVHHAPPG